MKTFVRSSFAALSLGSVAVLASACGTDPTPQTVLCTDFRVGADLTTAEFGVGASLTDSYGAFAQAAGDVASVASEILRDVGSSCQAFAIELGADANDERVVGKVDPDRSRAWCEIAVERFGKVRAPLDAAHFALHVELPRCAVDTEYQTACEARCQTDPSCVEATPDERCAAADREGVCTGLCTGTCQGSETAPAACAGGTCAGTCIGTCGDEDCSGAGCSCAQGCTGVCTAGCEAPEGGSACDARCTGGCTKPLVGQVCTNDLAAPRCAGDADCQRSCKASAAARAACQGGSFAVTIDEDARDSAELARLVGVMERHLPAVFVAARGRAELLEGNAKDLVDSAGNILAKAEDLGPVGAACGILIGETGDAAKKNLNAALNGSRQLSNAVVAQKN